MISGITTTSTKATKIMQQPMIRILAGSNPPPKCMINITRFLERAKIYEHGLLVESQELKRVEK